MKITKTFFALIVFSAASCSIPVPPPAVDPTDKIPGQSTEIQVAEPDFGQEVKVLPEAGASKEYSPSLLKKTFKPVSTQYKQNKTASWVNAEVRILPYLGGFDDWEMTRAEYVQSTNKYGSSTLLPKQEATGRFYVKKIANRFWLVDPYGYLHHHRGVASFRPSKDQRKNDNAAFMNKYSSRAAWCSEVQEELASIGIHGTGAFSTEPEDVRSHNRSNSGAPLLMCPSFGFLGAFKNATGLEYCNGDKSTAICMVLDDRWEEFCKTYVKDETKTEGVYSYLNDPNVIGIFSDNEIDFTGSTMLLNRVLNSANTTHPAFIAAKQFMTEKGAATVTDALNQEWVGMLAEKYYKAIKEALKEADPGILYLGTRLHGVPKETESIFRVAGKYCDVVSINYYGKWSVDAHAHVKKWTEWAPETPFMITEFYTKADDSQLRNEGGAGFIVPTQRERAFAYQHFALGLLEAKHCVGWHWFKYQDDDPTDPDYGEADASNKGLYDLEYNLYPWLGEYVKNLNYNVYRLIEYFDN